MRWILLLVASGGLALSGCSGDDPEAKAVKSVADDFITAWCDGKTETTEALATKKLRPFLKGDLGSSGETNTARRVVTLETLLPREGKASVRGTIPLRRKKEPEAGVLCFSLTLLQEDGQWKVDSLDVTEDEKGK